MYTGPAGRASPWPIPMRARAPVNPPMLRGVKVAMNVEIMTRMQPEIMAHLRPKVLDIGAERKKPVLL